MTFFPPVCPFTGAPCRPPCGRAVGPGHCKITLHFEGREDGGLSVWSDDLPGLVLSHSDRELVLCDIGPAIGMLIAHAAASSASTLCEEKQ